MPVDPEDFASRYTFQQASDASGVEVGRLRSWVSAKPQVVLLADAEREKAGKGIPMLFSFRRVLQIALTSAIAELGPEPRQAALMAAAFTDLSDGAFSEDEASHVRQACELYEDGLTFLVGIGGRRGLEAQGQCVRVTPTTPALLLLRAGLARDVGSPGAVILEVNGIYHRVRAALGA